MPRKTPTRDRAQTEAVLIQAVGQVLARDGFVQLGVNAIAREAGVDKVLIYRYFGGLQELLAAYGSSGDFWPSLEEVVGGDLQGFLARPLHERATALVVGLVDALRKRPHTIDVLAWESVQKNALTEALAAARESWSLEVIKQVMPETTDGSNDTATVAALLVAGCQHLLIRARMSPAYAGIEIHTDAGWQRITAAVRAALSNT